MPDSSVLSVVAVCIGDFLDNSDLLSCERAQIFSPYIIEWLWEVAGSKMLDCTPLWNITANHFAENDLRGKALISQIKSLKRGVSLSQWLKPAVVKTSFCSVKATPMSTAHPIDLYDDQSDDHFAMYPARQGRTGVAVTVGTNFGQPLVIGVKFGAASSVGDNLCLGIEAVGCIGSDHLMSITFAPFSGTCFIEHESGVTIQTKALPSVCEVSEGYAWIQVTEKGGIRFLRQFKDGKVEDAGLLLRPMLSDWAQTYFGSIDFWLRNLEVAVDVSVEYLGCAFPSDMSLYNKQMVEIQTPWSWVGETIW